MNGPEQLVLDLLRDTSRGLTGPDQVPGFAQDTAAWERAIGFSDQLQAALPFAARVRQEPWAPQLPPAVADRLEQIESRSRMTLALLDGELEAALGALLGARIPVILLKGADLARRFYPSRILRPMGDVDLLVPQSAYHEAWRAMEAEGFAATEQRYDHCFRSALARSGECPSVDLHFSLIAGDTGRRLDQLWARSLKAGFADLPAEVRVLAAEDCLVYVLRHAAVLHVLESPIWLGDLHFLVRGTPQLDWDFVLRELGETGSRSAAWFVFGILAEHWGTPIPVRVLEELRRRVGALRRVAASRRGELGDWFPEGGRSRFWMLRSRYLLRDGASEALSYAFGRWLRLRRERAADRREFTA